MAHRRGLGLALVVGFIPALALAGLLALRGVGHARAVPSPTLQALAAAPIATSIPAPTATAVSPTNTPPAATLTATIGPTPDRPASTLVPTATLPLPTATPAGPTWVEVGHWRDSQLIVTETFTVQGPWRIRWHLATTAEPFTVMIEQGTATPVLLFGPAGATDGVLDQPQGGTYSLMLHNTIPYDVVVEDLRPPATPR